MTPIITSAVIELNDIQKMANFIGEPISLSLYVSILTLHVSDAMT